MGPEAPRTSPRPVPTGRLVLLFAAFAAWAACFTSLDYHAGLRRIDDGSQYLLIAKSLAGGRGFSNLALPGTASFVDLPSAFPLMLVPYWWFLAPHEGALCVAMGIAMALGAWLAFLWMSRILGTVPAYLIALAFAASPFAIRYSTAVMTEAPSVLLIYGGLWLTFRAGEKQGRGWEAWLALLAWLILFRLRLNTFPFLLVHLAVLGRRRQWVLAGAGAALAALWVGIERLWIEPGSGGYLAYDVTHRAREQADGMHLAWGLARGYAANLYNFLGGVYGYLVLPWAYELRPMDALKRAAVLLVAAWGLWGFYRLWRDCPEVRPYLVAFLLSWAPCFVERSSSLARYFIPSLPLFLACMALPVRSLPRLSESRRASLAAALLVAVVANQVLSSLIFRSYRDTLQERKDMAFLMEMIRQAPAPPDLVISYYHWQTYLETGVPSLWYPVQWRDAKARARAREAGRVWALVNDPGEAAAAIGATGEFALAAEPLARAGGLYLYEVSVSRAPREGPAAQAR